MAISKALSALAGVARGAKTLVEREEKETADLTKIGLKQTLENIATARKNHAETIKDFREQTAGVKALQKFTYKDPETGVLRPVTQGQAIALIESTGGVKEAFKALQDAEVAFKGEGKVGPIQYTTAGAIDKETTEAFTQEDDTVGIAPLSLAKGRGARAARNVQKAIDVLGLPKDGYKTPVGLPEVSGVQIVSLEGKDGDKIKAIGSPILLFNRDPDGNPTDLTPGFRGDDLNVYVFDAKIRKHRLIKENEFETYKHMPSEQQNKVPKSLFEVQENYREKYFAKGSYTDLRDQYDELRVGVQKLANGYEKMWPIARDRAVYSSFAKFVGNIANRVETEIAGINLLSGGQTNSKEAIATLDDFIATQQKRGVTTVANKAELLQAMVARHAYAYLQANNDSVRPSDADMQRAMEQFNAKNPEQFILKARSTLEDARNLATDTREQLLKHPAFTSYTVLRYDAEEKKAIEDLVENEKEFIAMVPADSPSFVLDENAKEQIIDTSDPTSEQLTVTLNVNGTPVKAVYNSKTKEFLVFNGRGRISMAEAKGKNFISEEDLSNLTN